MPDLLEATPEMAAEYARWFVNRLAYTRQSDSPNRDSGLFRGIDGQLSQELLKQGLVPEFFTRGGEVRPVPEKFADAVKLVTTAVSCANCWHCHGLI
jgi:hypothetical protein